MKFIEWDDTLSVKIESIDEEHKELIGMINEFYENVREQSQAELMAALIRRMKKYSVFHFSTEESYMRLYDFPGYEKHKKEHDAFIAKVADLEERFNNGRLIISFEVSNFLKKWVKNHIQKTDKMYSEFFIKKGIK